MAYLLNNLKDIQTVYTPDIECLIDDFLPYLSEFSFSKKVILDSMRFRMKFSNEKGEEGFSSELPLKTILGGIKLNLISRNADNLEYNFDYEYLLRNIDLDVFNTELNKRVSLDENKFIEIIDSNLEIMNTILFEKKLKKDIIDLLNSISSLTSLLSSTNEFDKIIINKYLSSYNRTYSSLETEYRPLINNKEIFKSANPFKSINSHGIGSFDLIKAFRPNPPSVGRYSDTMIEFITDHLEFDKFKKNKEAIISNTISNSSELNNHSDIFKSGKVYNYFIEYIEKHIIDVHIDYSYLFQRMLAEGLIHRLKHLEYAKWMKDCKWIKDKDYDVIFEKGGFRTLNKSTSANRENNFNSIFKI
ncbi:MAG: hypothetical protein RLZZ540_1757 [Bacteroidota bacterium]|jgi:hypothetical protein